MSGSRDRAQRAWLLVSASSSALLLLTGACSSTDYTPSPIADDGGADEAAPDGAAPSEPDADAGAVGPDRESPPPGPYDFTVKCAGVPCVRRLAARGGTHACAVLEDGSVRCWGANMSGQLGTGIGDDGRIPSVEVKPRPVHGITNATEVAATGRGRAGTTCTISGSGDVDCFGSDAWMQLGQSEGGSTEPFPTPTRVEGIKAKSLTLTNTFALAVGMDDHLWSWGTNDTLQLARDMSVSGVPSESEAARADRISIDVQACAGTTKTGFAVSKQGALLSWGGSTLEQLGRATSLRTGDPIPGPIALADVSSVTTGAAHACALGRGAVHCWGENEHGQLGTGRKAEEFYPARVVLPPDIHPVAVAAGGDNTCIIAADGDVYCWGANGSGQSGTATRLDQSIPNRIDGIPGEAVGLAVMDESACVLIRDGSLACWGNNIVGQLGRGTRDVDIHPVAAPAVFE